MVEKNNINNFTVSELEQAIETYPWFTLARNEYFKRILRLGQENIADASKQIGIFVLSRSFICKTMNERQTNDSQVAITPSETKPKYYVVGGDYFGKDDFEELEKSGGAYENISFNPISSTLSNAGQSYDDIPSEPETDDSFKPDDLPCTETLAGIYVDQGFYQKAIDVYSKLILLYPEKNIYFATLIEKIKSNYK